MRNIIYFPKKYRHLTKLHRKEKLLFSHHPLVINQLLKDIDLIRSSSCKTTQNINNNNNNNNNNINNKIMKQLILAPLRKFELKKEKKNEKKLILI